MSKSVLASSLLALTIGIPVVFDTVGYFVQSDVTKALSIASITAVMPLYIWFHFYQSRRVALVGAIVFLSVQVGILAFVVK